MGDLVNTYNFDTSQEASEEGEEEEGPGEEPEVNNEAVVAENVGDAAAEVGVDPDTGDPLEPLNV